MSQHIPATATACLVLQDGSILWGKGIGAVGDTIGEVCFNTSMTGYQEILTDPSYAGQLICFTFPHIGNTGTNPEDIETLQPAARGLILRENITAPSNWRNANPLPSWLEKHNLIGITGIDTRALTRLIRDKGAQTGVICHKPEAGFTQAELDSLQEKAKGWAGLEGMDLAKTVTRIQNEAWDESCWTLEAGYGQQTAPNCHIVAMDFGAKRNILRCLANAGAKVTVVPANTSAEDIISLGPDGVFLSNGPGDPAATGAYAVPTIQTLIKANLPIFGICLGHQMLALALGAKTVKMARGHRGANHPVKDLTTGKVEITSQNHGFMVDPDTLPEDVEISHISLFDGTNEGIRHKEKPIFSVQHHPEASPGPADSHYLFDRFLKLVHSHQQA